MPRGSKAYRPDLATGSVRNAEWPSEERIAAVHSDSAFRVVRGSMNGTNRENIGPWRRRHRFGGGPSAVRGGYSVVLHDDPKPPSTRRGMAFADAIFDGQAVLEGVRAVHANGFDQ